MKNILAENMLRFGVKNLNETATSKVKQLSEQDVAAPAANPKIQRIPGSTFNYGDGGGSSDSAVKAPLATITDNITFMRFNGTTTNVVEFRKDLIVFGTVADSKTTYSDSINPTKMPDTFHAVEKIARWLGSDLTNTLIAIVWLNDNYTAKFGAGRIITTMLRKLNTAGTFTQVWDKNAQTIKFDQNSNTWITAMKAAKIITA